MSLYANLEKLYLRVFREFADGIYLTTFEL